MIERLIARGSHPVTVLEMLPKVGRDIGRSTRWVVFAKLKRYGVKVRTGVKVLAVEQEGLRVEVAGDEELVPADTVILAAGARPRDELAAELAQRGLAVETVGDVAGAGSVLAAMAQGFEVGSKV